MGLIEFNVFGTKFGIGDLSYENEALSSYNGIIDEVVLTITNALEMNLHFARYEVFYPRGILFFGPDKKTNSEVIRRVATRIKYGFYHVNTSELLSKYYTESEENIVALFAEATKNAPCILFFDNLDVFLPDYSGHNINSELQKTFFKEVNKLKWNDKVMIIETVTEPWMFDSKFCKSAQFEKFVYLHTPTKTDRIGIFKLELNTYSPHKKQRTPILNIPINKDVDFDVLADMTDEWSWEDITTLCISTCNAIVEQCVKDDKLYSVSMKNLTDFKKIIKPKKISSKYQKFIKTLKEDELITKRG